MVLSQYNIVHVSGQVHLGKQSSVRAVVSPACVYTPDASGHTSDPGQCTAGQAEHCN